MIEKTGEEIKAERKFSIQEVENVFRNTIRTCSTGGMPLKEKELVERFVPLLINNLGYIAVIEHFQPEIDKATEKAKSAKKKKKKKK